MRVSNRPILALAAATILSACGADDAMLIAEILRGQQPPGDNPAPSSEPGPTPAPADEPPIDPLPPPDISDEQRIVQTILDVNCGACHQESVGFGGMTTTDIDELLRQGLIEPGNSFGSPIIIAMEQQRMPPPAVLDQRPTPQEVERVARFIDEGL